MNALIVVATCHRFLVKLLLLKIQKGERCKIDLTRVTIINKNRKINRCILEKAYITHNTITKAHFEFTATLKS